MVVSLAVPVLADLTGSLGHHSGQCWHGGGGQVCPAVAPTGAVRSSGLLGHVQGGAGDDCPLAAAAVVVQGLRADGACPPRAAGPLGG